MRYRTIIASLVALGTLTTSSPRASANPDDPRLVVHVLNRVGYGPSTASLNAIERRGVGAYIEEQLRPERLADSGMKPRLAGMTTLEKRPRELAEEFFLPATLARREANRRQEPPQSGSAREPQPRGTPEQIELARLQRHVIGELLQQRLLRAVYSDRQLEEVLVDFWMNHFNVFVGKGPVRLYLSEYEQQVIRPRVMGRFRDLLGATAESPAMLFYLDNWQSAAPAETSLMTTNRRPHPLRRQMDSRVQRPPQVRAKGLHENYARELMELHTLGVDGGYTQRDVQEVARAFTGWTISNPRLGGGFQFDARRHDGGEKIVLGHRIKGGGGKRDGDEVLDLLARHPATATFIATKLARRLVADDPPAALVERAARRFKDTDGDIREVVRTIVTSPEFLAPTSWRAKTKNPLEFVVSAVRVTGLEITNAMPLAQALRDLGMPLYGAVPPTGYADKAEAWVNSGALLERMNFALSLVSGQMRALDATAPVGPSSEEGAHRRLSALALADDVTAATSATVARASTPTQAAALILGSPEFQKR